MMKLSATDCELQAASRKPPDYGMALEGALSLPEAFLLRNKL
jgi:hypothetical protein